MPDSHPGITLDSEGVCNHCKTHEQTKNFNWSRRWKELQSICDSHRKNNENHDCIIAVSGGKDSHYIVGLFKETLDMNPLCVSLDNYSWTDTGRKNIKNLGERFDVDILTFTPARKTLKYHTRYNFEHSLHPNKYWDKLLYDLPSKIARKFGLYLVIWGEDTQYRNIPNASILSGKERKYLHELFTSYYVPWNRYDNLDYARENGFIDLHESREWYRYGMTNFPFEQIDTIGYLVNNYCKFIKFGYSNQTELCSDAIRQDQMTRNVAIEQINKYDWKLDGKMLNDFCEFIEISKELFWNIIDKFANQNILKKKDDIGGLSWRLKEDAHN
jgi:hypothetical protein